MDVPKSGVKQVEVNGVFKYGRCEKIELKSLQVTFNAKVFAMKDGQLAGHTHMTHYTDPYVIDMD